MCIRVQFKSSRFYSCITLKLRGPYWSSLHRRISMFLQKLVDLYTAGISNIFTVTGNISDVMLENNTQETTPRNMITQKFGKNNHVIVYSPSRGMRYVQESHKKEFLGYDEDLAEKHKKIFSLDYAESRYNIVSGLHHIKALIEEYRNLRRITKDVKNLCIVLEDADIIFPNKPLSQIGADEKMMMSLAREVFANPQFSSGQDLVIMLSKDFYGLSDDIRAIPMLENIEVDLPNFESRRKYIQYVSRKINRRFGSLSHDKIATLSAGISLANLKSILMEKSVSVEENIVDEVSKIISRSMDGKVSIVIPSHGYDAVIGYDKVKTRLKKLKKRMFLKNNDLVWKGLMFIGPTGVGKDFILEAFVDDIGLPAIKIGNLKSKWYGETLQIVEQLKRIVRSFDKVILIKTEADTMFSNPESSDGHQTDKEMMGIFLDWMGDNKDRGKIYWVFNTSRPQNLPTDFQRRVEIKIPLFDLTGDDKWNFICKMCSLFDFSLEDNDRNTITEATKGLSNSNLRDLAAEIAVEYALVDSHEDVIITDIIENLNFSVVEDARKQQAENAKNYSTYKDLII